MAPSARTPPAGMPATPTVRAAILRFLIGSAVALVVVAAAGFLAIRTIALDEARRDTAERVRTIGNLVEGAGLGRGLLDADPAAVRRLDQVLPASVVRGSVVRVKIWRADGTILYSDAPELIGERYPLGEEEREILEDGGSEVELSDLAGPENRLERREGGKLLEAYTRVTTPDGRHVLFEIYQRFSFVTAARDRILGQLFLPLLLGLLLVGVIQIPLVRQLIRGLGEAAAERERLLEHAAASARAERLRIASDLSAGAVDELAPLSGRLDALAVAAAADGRARDADELRATAHTIGHGVRQLRSELGVILPPNLGGIGLEQALHELLVPLATRGITITLDVQPLDGAAAELAYRVAREAIRNAELHAGATSIAVSVARESTPAGGHARLTVTDDGTGFVAAERDEAEHAGRRGLRIVDELVRDQGGELIIRSGGGRGTTVEATFPVA